MGITLDSTKVVGHKVLDVGGNKIGSAGMVYHDHTSSHQDWVMVKGGLLGGRTHFAPLSGASMVADDVRLAYDKAMIDSAPEMDGNRQLSAEEELALYQHYGLGGTAGNGSSGLGAATVAGSTMASTTATAPTRAREMRGTENGYLTRSEERMRVATERVETGHARLHKYVTTEQVNQTVPVTHEEVRVEREQIVAGSPEAARITADFAEADQDVVLHADRTVVSKETVPVERVRMRVEEVTENVTVSDQVRVEHIDFENEDPESATAKGAEMRTATEMRTGTMKPGTTASDWSGTKPGTTARDWDGTSGTA